MKRTSMALFVALTIVALNSIAPGQPSERPRPGRPEEALAARRQNAEQGQWVQRVRKQIAEMRQDHEALIVQLRAIHANAVKEKATDTAHKVEELIAACEKTYQERITQLQQQQRRAQNAMRERPQRRGRRAPDFELKSFDGQTVSLAQYKGRVVVLEWFNMNCPFSKYHYETKTTMVDLANKYKDKEVVWLTINSTSSTTPEANLAFAKKHKLPFPILDDRAGRVGRAYGARTTPHVIVIDKEGIIAYNGAIDSAPLGKPKGGVDTIGYVDQALAQLTTGQKVTTPATAPYGCSVKYADR